MESNIKTLEEVIFSASTYQIKIPKYQRPYSWGLQQVEELWDDIIQTNPTFFIGPIIINTENLNRSHDSFIEIVDGQQRLISSTILSAVLRDAFKDFGDVRKANIIQDRFIAFLDDNGDDQGYRLTTGQSTHNYFQENIQDENSNIENSIPETKEHKKIKDNYLTLKKKLYEYIKPETSTENKIKKISFVRDRLKQLNVIEIQINNDREAYEIFERVNNYGVDLSLSDLLKNHILKNSDEKEKANQKWLDIEKNIRNSGSEMKKFIRYHWLSKYSFKTEKQLYNNIKDEIQDYDKFVNELEKASEIYSNIIGANLSDYAELKVNRTVIGKKIYNVVQASNYMSVTQDNVFYMSLIRNTERGKLLVNPKKFLIFLEKFIFKYFAICHFPANKVERLFSKYAIELEKICNKDISESNIKQNTDRLFTNFKSDLEELAKTETIRDLFIEKFEEVKYGSSPKNRKLINYILSKYENKLHGRDELTLNFEIINIEHLLPQKPENWGLTKKDVKEYVNNIGNLVLIDQRLNGQMGNKSLEEKIPILNQSLLEMNKLIVNQLNNNAVWNENLIQKRNKDLAIISYDEIWSY